MISLSLSAGSGFASATKQLVGFSAITLQNLLRWQAMRKTEAELFELNDRMLRDIGLHRSEISSISQIPFDPTRIPR
jgi:uncharacterized protein YjiS (DUF1127 family)